MFMQERKDTGRIYLMNVDHANDHGSFLADKAPVRQSNICAEITLPTKPLNDINDAIAFAEGQLIVPFADFHGPHPLLDDQFIVTGF